MIIYDKFITLSSHETSCILGVEFITTFNINTRNVLHIIAIYKLSALLFSTFMNQLQKLLDIMITYCPTIIRGDFNIYKLHQNSTQPNELKFFMNHYSMELQFKKIMTNYDTHIDHIWTNASTQQYMFGCVEAYWTDNKSILFAFKLSNYVSQYHHIS
jgi:uncharacterized protein YsxB (DUF464 family)